MKYYIARFCFDIDGSTINELFRMATKADEDPMALAKKWAATMFTDGQGGNAPEVEDHGFYYARNDIFVEITHIYEISEEMYKSELMDDLMLEINEDDCMSLKEAA
jgi:hypothetical protein